MELARTLCSLTRSFRATRFQSLGEYSILPHVDFAALSFKNWIQRHFSVTVNFSHQVGFRWPFCIWIFWHFAVLLLYND